MSAFIKHLVEFTLIGPRIFINTMEMGLSAMSVIALRTQILICFSRKPNMAGLRESYRMISEKYVGTFEAYASAAKVVAAPSNRSLTIGLIPRNTLKSFNPFALWWRFVPLSIKFFVRMINLGVESTLKGLTIYQRAMSPLRSRVMKNAKQLRKWKNQIRKMI